MTYEEALNYIHSYDWRGSRPGLSRITELSRLLSNPEGNLKFIHIAGTNGKGSVSTMLSSILSKAGYKVGLFTSPYIESFNERIILAGESIANEDLAKVTEYVRGFAETMEDKPTEFELITAIALEYYKRQKADYVVWECGLGGRLDSTNIVKTTVLSIIVSIALDHTELLGDTTEKIAAEKAGIIKPSVPVLFGEGDCGAFKVISDTANELNSPLYRTDFSKITNISSDLSGTDFCISDKKYNLSLHGLYQTRNAATVIEAVRILRKQGLKISDENISDGVRSAEWKARFEILSSNPLVIYDGAHNPHGISGAVENIEHYLAPLTSDGRVVLLMGVMADKDYTKMISELSNHVSKVFTVKAPNARALTAEGICHEFMKYSVEAEAFSELEDGVHAAVDYAEKCKTPLVCLGSLYMYSDVKKAVFSMLHEVKT